MLFRLVCSGVLSLTLFFSLSAPTMAAPRCGLKIQQLERQIGYAKAQGQQHRLRGLQRALANVRARCHASPQAAQSVTEQQAWREVDIAKQRLRIQERQLDLQQTRSVGYAAWLRWQLQQDEAVLREQYGVD